MSIASARDLYSELLVNAELARQVDALENEDERWSLLRAQGYDFTRQEWEQVQHEVEAFIAFESGELDDAALELVNGGGATPGDWLPPAARERLQAGAPPVRL